MLCYNRLSFFHSLCALSEESCNTAGSTVFTRSDITTKVKPQKPFSTGPGYFMVDMGDSAHSGRTPKQRSAVMDFEDECEAV